MSSAGDAGGVAKSKPRDGSGGKGGLVGMDGGGTVGGGSAGGRTRVEPRLLLVPVRVGDVGSAMLEIGEHRLNTCCSR
jgi:hypothetical protein